jgi:hypothetical protein
VMFEELGALKIIVFIGPSAHALGGRPNHECRGISRFGLGLGCVRMEAE